MSQHPQPFDLPRDEPPKDGVWRDEHPHPTREEITDGNRLGKELGDE